MFFKKYIDWLNKYFKTTWDFILAAGMGMIFVISMIGHALNFVEYYKKKKQKKPAIRLINK